MKESSCLSLQNYHCVCLLLQMGSFFYHKSAHEKQLFLIKNCHCVCRLQQMNVFLATQFRDKNILWLLTPATPQISYNQPQLCCDLCELSANTITTAQFAFVLQSWGSTTFLMGGVKNLRRGFRPLVTIQHYGRADYKGVRKIIWKSKAK